jgi:hypothetical protein
MKVGSRRARTRQIPLFIYREFEVDVLSGSRPLPQGNHWWRINDSQFWAIETVLP